MNVYDLLDKMAIELREYIDRDDVPESEKFVGGEVLSNMVEHLTFFDDGEEMVE